MVGKNKKKVGMNIKPKEINLFSSFQQNYANQLNSHLKNVIKTETKNFLKDFKNSLKKRGE